MKYLLFLPERGAIAHVIAMGPGATGADVSRYARRRSASLMQTGENAMEDIELRREKDVLEVRTRQIGESGPWSEWKPVEEARR